MLRRRLSGRTVIRRGVAVPLEDTVSDVIGGIGSAVGGVSNIVGSAIRAGQGGGTPQDVMQNVLGNIPQLLNTARGAIPGIPAVGADQILTTLSGQIAQMGGQVPFIAPYAQALQTTLAGQMQQPVQEHQEKTGRAVVDRTTAAVAPILSEIQSKLRQRATQVQATAEHRTIEAEAAFQREVRGKLNTILGRLNNSAPRRY